MTADINAAKERLTKLADDTGAHYGSDRLGWLVGDVQTADLRLLLAELSRLEHAVTNLAATQGEELARIGLARDSEREEAAAALAEAYRQIAERDEALKPFAERAEFYGPVPADGMAVTVALRSCRRAAALLSSEQKEEESSRISGQRGCGSRDEASAPATAALAKVWEDEIGRVSVERGDPLFSVWEAIGQDVRLRAAREKLSAHEITLIVGHARATAPVHEQGEG